MKKKYQIKCDGIGLNAKEIINIQRPHRNRKYIIQKERLVQNPLCGSFLVRELYYKGGIEIITWSMEWVPYYKDIRKNYNPLPRIRISYTEEELEYFRIMKELEEEKKQLEKLAS